MIAEEVALDGYTGKRCEGDCYYYLWCGAVEPLYDETFVPDV